MYTSSSLQIPWYVIAGNHDHYGNVTGQIDYTRHSNLWKFPNFYHSHEFTIPGTSMSVQIILIDTVLLCGHSGHDHHPKPLTGIINYLRLILPSFAKYTNGGKGATVGTCPTFHLFVCTVSLHCLQSFPLMPVSMPLNTCGPILFEFPLCSEHICSFPCSLEGHPLCYARVLEMGQRGEICPFE